MVKPNEGNVNTPNNLNSQNIDNEEIMIPYERVLLIAWGLELGKELERLRKSQGMTRPEVVIKGNGAFSKDTLKSLEYGRVGSVSREILEAILSALNSDIRDIFPTVSVKKFSSTP